MHNNKYKDRYYYLNRYLESLLLKKIMEDSQIYLTGCKPYDGGRRVKNKSQKKVVADLGKFKIEVRPREDSRHIPHMHIIGKDYEASVSFEGKVIAGYLPSKIKKIVIEWIKGPDVINAINAWNEFHQNRPTKSRRVKRNTFHNKISINFKLDI